VLGRFAANRARFREGVRRQHAQCYRAQTRPDDTVFFLPYSGFNFFLGHSKILSGMLFFNYG
jgi:hypothetical protein